MVLIETTRQVADQLRSVISQLSDEQYAEPLPLLSGNSIGKHTRHILEFYDCLARQMAGGVVNYDRRERNLALENSGEKALENLAQMETWLAQIREDRALKLEACYLAEQISTVETTLFRELAYNIEHTIHHLAIIKIALQGYFNEVSIPENFGVAYSTVQYQNPCAR